MRKKRTTGDHILSLMDQNLVHNHPWEKQFSEHKDEQIRQER